MERERKILGGGVYESVCVCTCVSVYVSKRQCVSEREREREKETERGECMCDRECVSLYVTVCVCDREYVSLSACVTECVSVSAHLFLHSFIPLLPTRNNESQLQVNSTCECPGVNVIKLCIFVKRKTNP